MECCGKTCVTKYCPYCGRFSGKASPLQSLLNHIRKTEGFHRATAETRREFASSLEAGTYEHTNATKRLVSAQDAAVKWTLWGDALEALMTPAPGAAP